jgi:hypothetical protein
MELLKLWAQSGAVIFRNAYVGGWMYDIYLDKYKV